MFTKILIANRGEIAVRVARSCRAWASSDGRALHRGRSIPARARRRPAIDLGEGPASENYLNIHKIIAAAIESDAQAIHPGYGFLSENAEFAERRRGGHRRSSALRPRHHHHGRQGRGPRRRHRGQVPLAPGRGPSPAPT